MEVSTAVARPRTGNALTLMEEQFSPEQRAQIANFLEIPAEHPALIPYLAICAQYGLDPVMGQIWLIEQKRRGRDGEGRGKLLKPAVGRDGLLAIARRTPEYEGMEADIVHAKDTFEVRREGGKLSVFHEYGSIPGEFKEGESPTAYRGPILGAFALVKVRGHEPTFYFAPLNEHAQTGTDDAGGKYYRGAWSYTSVMILKAAQSVALRLALGVTGIVPADEIRPGSADDRVEEEAGPVLTVEEVIDSLNIEGAEDQDYEALKAAVRSANESEANSWGGAKLRIRLEGRKVEDLRGVIEEISEEVRLREERFAREASLEDAVMVLRPEEVEAGQLIEHGGEYVEVKDIIEPQGEDEPFTFFLGEESREVGIEPTTDLNVRAASVSA